MCDVCILSWKMWPWRMDQCCILVSCEVDFCHFVLSTSLPHLTLDISHILLHTPRSPRLHTSHLSHTLHTSPHTLCTSLLTPCTTLSSCRLRSSYCTPSSFHITLLSFTFHTHISMSHLSPHSSLFTLHIHISHLAYQFANHSRIAE